MPSVTGLFLSIPLVAPRRGGGTRYQMRQKMVSIGQDFWIENDQGEKVFKVDGKALRVRNTLKFEDAHGNEQCKIQERMLRVKDSMEVEVPGGQRMAMVKKALATPVRERWVVKIKGGIVMALMTFILPRNPRQARKTTGCKPFPERAFLWPFGCTARLSRGLRKPGGRAKLSW